MKYMVNMTMVPNAMAFFVFKKIVENNMGMMHNAPKNSTLIRNVHHNRSIITPSVINIEEESTDPVNIKKVTPNIPEMLCVYGGDILQQSARRFPCGVGCGPERAANPHELAPRPHALSPRRTTDPIVNQFTISDRLTSP